MIWQKIVDYRQSKTLTWFTFASAHSGGISARSNHANSTFQGGSKIKRLFSGQVKGKSGHLVFLIVNTGNRVLTVQIDQVGYPEQLSCVESCKIRKTLGITTFGCNRDVIIWPKIVDYRQSKTLTGFKFAPAHSGGVSARSNHANLAFRGGSKTKKFISRAGKRESCFSNSQLLKSRFDGANRPSWAYLKSFLCEGMQNSQNLGNYNFLLQKWCHNLTKNRRLPPKQTVTEFKFAPAHSGGVSARSNHANSAFRGSSKIKKIIPRAGKREERPSCLSISQLWKSRFDDANRPSWASWTTFLCWVMQNSQNLGNYNFLVQTWRHNLTKKIVDYRHSKTLTWFKFAPAHSGGASAKSNHANSALRGGSKVKIVIPRAGKGE